MAAPALFLPTHRRTPRRRIAASVLVAAMPIAAVAATWPLLVAAPMAGGPLAALAAGLGAWTIARAAAPRPHANDNGPRAVSRATETCGRSRIGRPGARPMFGTNAKAEPRRAGGLSVIGADVTVTGNVATDGDLHVDGTIEGDVRCGSLVQGQSGRIVGSIVAKAARIAGTIEGRVSAASLTIERAARLRGDSDYGTLQIENGAQIDGRLTHLADDAREVPLRLVDASDAG